MLIVPDHFHLSEFRIGERKDTGLSYARGNSLQLLTTEMQLN